MKSDTTSAARTVDVQIIGLDDLTPNAPARDDTVVVIDVIFAFSVAARVVAAGATAIQCVETVDDAWNAARSQADPFLMGEVSGLAPLGFDAGNSPIELAAHDLTGRSAIQRTRFGTRGLTRCKEARGLFAVSAANAKATVQHVATTCNGRILLVPTGTTSEDGCVATYMAQLINGQEPCPEELGRCVVAAADEHQASWLRDRGADELERFVEDVDLCAQVDSLDIVLQGQANKWGVLLRRPSDCRGIR